MTKSYLLTKEELEYYINAKAWTREQPGYFKDGKFRHGLLYVACLGKKQIGYADGFPSYVSEAGGYFSRQEALRAAKAFKQKMREWLEAGNYRENATP